MISLSTLVLLTIVDCYPLWGRTSSNFSVTFSPDFLTLWLALKASSLLHSWYYVILVLSCIILVRVGSKIYNHVALLISYLIHPEQSAGYFLRLSYLISF